MAGCISNFLAISRAKLQIASLPHATLGIFLAASGLSTILNLSVLIYILLLFVMITFACNLNCLYDFGVDKKYKKYMSNAVEAIGIKNIKIIVILELVLISYFLFNLWSRGHAITVFISLLGLLFAISYSVEPIRIKKRGFFSPFPVFIGLYTLPVLGGWFLLNTTLPLYFIVFVIGYALINEGITLVNTCEDYTEDNKERIKTWAHIFGLKKTLLVAFIFTLFGGIALSSSLLFVLLKTSSSMWLISTLFVVISAVVMLRTALDIYNISKSDNLERAAKEGAKKMPKWFMTTRYPLFFAVLLLLL